MAHGVCMYVNVSLYIMYFRQQAETHESRCCCTSCSKLTPWYLATISFDLADSGHAVNTAGVQRDYITHL